MIDKIHPFIATSLRLSKASNDLKQEFGHFLCQFPETEKHVLYLMKDKKQRIEDVIHDLFDVAPKEQSDWKKPSETIPQGEVDESIRQVIETYKNEHAKTEYIGRRHIFSDWKQEHGFESIPPEIGDIHTIIRIRKTYSETFGSAVIWSFNRSRYGKWGWGNERLIKNPTAALLDNNNNPGWSVRQYLEENLFAEPFEETAPTEQVSTATVEGDTETTFETDDAAEIEGNFAPDHADSNHHQAASVTDAADVVPTSANHYPKIPNPLILSSYDSHCLLYMLFGHPLLFIGQQGTNNVRNAMKNCQFVLNYFIASDHSVLWGSFEIQRDERVITVNPDDILDTQDNFFLYGTPPGLIHDLLYYRVDETVMASRMIEASLHGVMLTGETAGDCLDMLQKTYGHIEIRECTDEDRVPRNLHRNLRPWYNWFSRPQQDVPLFADGEDPVIIRLDPRTAGFNANRVALKISNLANWRQRLQHPEKVPRFVNLFRTLERAIQDQKTDKGAYIFERVVVSQILSYCEEYPFAFGLDDKPLVADRDCNFRITVKTRENENRKFSLNGKVTLEELSQSKSVSFQNENGDDDIRVFGVVPCFFLHEGQMCRVNDYCSGRLVNDTLNGVHVDETEIVDFYATAIPYLKKRGISISDPEGLLRVSALYNYRLTAAMHIREVKGLLTGNLSFVAESDLGKFDYPRGNESDEFSQVVDGVSYQIPRNYSQEQDLFDKLADHGWVDEGEGEYAMREENTMAFFMEIVPALPEDSEITYYGTDNLKKWKVQEIQPQISTGIKSNIDWFDCDLTIEFDGHAIDIQQILKFWKSPKTAIKVEGKEGLIVIGKEWLAKFAPILNRLAESNKTKKNTPEGATKLRVEKYHLGLVSELEKAANKKSGDKKWRETVARLDEIRRPDTIAVPKGVKAQMRDYQLDGVRWLLFLREFGFGGILADDMGLGKTLQILCFLAYCKEHQKISLPCLVVAPTSVAGNWINEIKKFVPHFTTVMLHGVARRGLYREINRADLVVTTYGLIQRDIEELSEFRFDVLILDEAQIIKNSRSKTSSCVARLNANMRLSVSGTPIENSVSELWSQFNFLMPGFLGNLKNFQSLYINTFQKNSEKKREAYSFLRWQTRPFIMRRMKQQVAKELPPKTEQMLYCEMDPEQKRLYESVLELVRRSIKDKIDKDGLKQAKITIFDALTKLRLICSAPALSHLAGESPQQGAKMKLFIDTVSEIVSEGHRVLVFSHFVKVLNLMHAPLNKINVPFLQLDGSSKNRTELVDRFQNDEHYPVMLISLKAGGTGLNLTAADYVIHYDPWWNPAVEAQATDRAYRIGQNNQVFVYKLITKHSIEEKILELQSQKMSVAETVVGTSDDLETMLNMDTIKEIFQI